MREAAPSPKRSCHPSALRTKKIMRIRMIRPIRPGPRRLRHIPASCYSDTSSATIIAAAVKRIRAVAGLRRGWGFGGRGGIRAIARKQPATAARASLDATAGMMHAAQGYAAVVAALGKPAKRGKATLLPVRNSSVDFTFQGPGPADAGVGGLHLAVTMCADCHYVLFMRIC